MLHGYFMRIETNAYHKILNFFVKKSKNSTVFSFAKHFIIFLIINQDSVALKKNFKKMRMKKSKSILIQKCKLFRFAEPAGKTTPEFLIRNLGHLKQRRRFLNTKKAITSKNKIILYLNFLNYFVKI